MADGLILVACGLGLVWSARAYTEVSAEHHEAMAVAYRARGFPRWVRRVHEASRPRRGALAFNYLLGIVALAAGVARLAGLW